VVLVGLVLAVRSGIINSKYGIPAGINTLCSVKIHDFHAITEELFDTWMVYRSSSGLKGDSPDGREKY
jgi:hypothetical protein